MDVYNLPEPIKSYSRNIALLKLIHVYGGMIVPDTFLCTKNMRQLYYDGIYGQMPFVCEKVNRTSNMQQKPRLTLVPDLYFMGAPKRNVVVESLIEQYERLVKQAQYTDMIKFTGDMNEVLVRNIQLKKMNLIEFYNISIPIGRILFNYNNFIQFPFI